MNIKELYRRFRAWQINPFSYENHSDHTERCANCGTEFQANFCPVCGQKSGVGPIGWNTVRQGLMVIWGMDSRSLGFSIAQLLLRPGYLISDYISGKRQVSFPPVKMLLIVAIGVVMANAFVSEPQDLIEEANEVSKSSFDAFSEWADKNPGWAMMTLCCLMLLPTWLMFRFAPKHRKHTLPEGFFIQVFMATLLTIIGIITMLTDYLGVLWLLLLYYIVAYRQLFGYSWWGTLWRMCVCLWMVFATIYNLQELGNYLLDLKVDSQKTLLFVGGMTIFIVLIGVLFEYRNSNRNKMVP